MTTFLAALVLAALAARALYRAVRVAAAREAFSAEAVEVAHWAAWENELAAESEES